MVIYLKLGCSSSYFKDGVSNIEWTDTDIREYDYSYLTPNIEKALFNGVLVVATAVEYIDYTNGVYRKDLINCRGVNTRNPINDPQKGNAFSDGFSDGFS